MVDTQNDAPWKMYLLEQKLWPFFCIYKSEISGGDRGLYNPVKYMGIITNHETDLYEPSSL